MKKPVLFALDIRLGAALCCAVLLSACGAGATGDRGQPLQTAAVLNSSAEQSIANSAPATPGAADAALAPLPEAAPVDKAEPAGGEGAATQADAAASAAPAPADGPAEPAPPIQTASAAAATAAIYVPAGSDTVY